MEITPYTCFLDYLALKTHFTSETYDYHRYNGKVNIKYSVYDKRHDKFFFEKLSKKNNCHDLLLASISDDPEKWIGDIVDDEESYKKWKKTIQSMEYTFTEDIKKMDFSDLNLNFKVKNGEYPKLLELYNQGDIHKETLIILNYIFKFTKHWNNSIKDTIIWPKIYFNMKKYSSFLNIDEYKYKELFKKHFKNY